MKFYCTICLLVFTVVFSSCKKDKNDKPVKTINVKEITDENGNRVIFIYDDAGRVSERRYLPYLSASYSETETFRYDNGGRINNMITTLDSVSYTYNQQGQLTRKERTRGYKKFEVPSKSMAYEYKYDAGGKVVQTKIISDPGSPYQRYYTYSYNYNAANLVSKITYTDDTGGSFYYKVDDYNDAVKVDPLVLEIPFKSYINFDATVLSGLKQLPQHLSSYNGDIKDGSLKYTITITDNLLRELGTENVYLQNQPIKELYKFKY
ncbi:hypothetical protein GCM10023149_49150 [Mucilaginibacter gynuensis]|uniref:YD repeat-containing protein n=1 Tax=Mucilaginibacter gynuensis TaxID=1302236 RepID=A0ABP8HFZ4_9SPHI